MSKKIYKFPELKALAKEQGYKLACLEDKNQTRIQSNNPLTLKVDKQLDILESRLKNEIYPDGIYYVCLAQSITKTRNPDRYPIVKGKYKATNDELSENNKPTIIHQITPSVDVLSYESALAMQGEIAELKAEKAQLLYENEILGQKITDLEAELKESEGLQENSAPSNTQKFLSELFPSVLPIAEKYFETENRKIALEEKKLQNRFTQVKNDPAKKTERKIIEPGSDEHLLLIEQLFNTDQDEKLNIQLDRLQAVDKAKHDEVCERLGIDLNESEEEQP